MTRDETIKYGLDLCSQEFGLDGSIFIPKLVNTAYGNCADEFESRVCENCKHYHYCQATIGLSELYPMHTYIKEIVGGNCMNFEREIDED